MKYRISCMIAILLFSTPITPAEIQMREIHIRDEGKDIQQPLLIPATRRPTISCAKALKVGWCLLAAVVSIGGTIRFTQWIREDTSPMPIPCEQERVVRVQAISESCNNTGCPGGFSECNLCLLPNPDLLSIQKHLEEICPGSPKISIWHFKQCKPVPACRLWDPFMKRLNETCNPTNSSSARGTKISCKTTSA